MKKILAGLCLFLAASVSACGSDDEYYSCSATVMDVTVCNQFENEDVATLACSLMSSDGAYEKKACSTTDAVGKCVYDDSTTFFYDLDEAETTDQQASCEDDSEDDSEGEAGTWSAL